MIRAEASSTIPRLKRRQIAAERAVNLFRSGKVDEAKQLALESLKAMGWAPR
jgi:hypothetical protein